MTNSQDQKLQVAVFDRLSRAEGAVARLVAAGVAQDRISVVCSDCAPSVAGAIETVDTRDEQPTRTVVTGGAIGTVLGGLAAGVGVAATGGTGLLVAGPLLTGATAGGVGGGRGEGFLGAMTRRGVKPEIADYYEQALRDGQVLVAVEPPEPGSAQPSLHAVETLLAEAGGRAHELSGK